MTISNKILLAIPFFFVASLARAEISTLANFVAIEEMTATPLQILGVSMVCSYSTLYSVGKLLIKNGHEHIKLPKTRGLKTPKAMKTCGQVGILVGLASMTSPIIFDTAERLGKQHREQGKKELKAKQPSDELAS